MTRRRKIFWVTLVSLLLVSTSLSVRFLDVAKANPSVIRVPSDYPTIQAAINAAQDGDTVLVAAGMYRENVRVNKTVLLVGESPSTTIVDGGGDTAFIITAQNAEIEGFTIQNATSPWPAEASGIRVFASGGQRIRNNVLVRNYYGINLLDALDTVVSGNTVANNSYAGVRIRGGNNLFYENTIANNSVLGVWIASATSPNTLYRNNFLNNADQADSFDASTRWDNGAEGNYWSDYVGQDLNGDGIGDTNTPHLSIDKYPLMEPWRLTRVYQVGAYRVTVKSNATIASFNFNQAQRLISFNATGPSGKRFFSNVTVPKALLNAVAPQIWLVTLNGTDVTAESTITANASFTSFYFERGFSTYNVRIRVVGAVTADFTWTPTSVFVGAQVAFDASASTPDGGTIVSYEWDFGDGTPKVVEGDPVVTHVYAVAGTQTVTLTVTDSEGASATWSKQLTVKPLPVADFSWSPIFPHTGEEVTFNASASKPDGGTLVSFEWDFGDGSPRVTEADPVTTHTYSALGIYTVTLNVTDSEASSATRSRQLKVGFSPVADFSWSPLSPQAGQEVTFNASASTPNGGSIVGYRWDFGDGKPLSGGSSPIQTHVFSLDGTYSVVLNVTDTEGTWTVRTKQVIIRRAPSTDLTPYIIGGGVAVGAIVIVALAVVMRKRRR